MASDDSQKDSLDINTLSFKLPRFTPSNLRVLFTQIEALFVTSRINSERTRYSYVLQSLPFDVAVTVEDLLDPIAADKPYTLLKEAVIQRVAKSANLMLRELFTQVELGDQTPSQLMRHMRSLLAVKRPRQPVLATTAAGPSRPSRLFYINDKSSGLRFLADTGAEVSVIPPLRRHRLKPSQFSLQAANSTTISTYGQRSLTLDLVLWRHLVRAYDQIPVAEEDIPKTAITTPFGLFEFIRMPFGLRNAAQSFQRFIDEILRGLPFAYAYIDDILVASSSAEEHASHLRRIFDRFQQHGLQLNVDKCVFGVNSLDFLGHHVDQHGITPLTEKVQCILSFPVPNTLTQLRRFIGFINYYGRFIPHCAAILAPLTDLLKSKAKPIELSPAAHTAFGEAKKALADATMLHHLRYDAHAQLILTTDASSSAVGAVLHQQVNNQLQPLAFFSQKLQPAQTHYSTFSRELLAIYLAIRHFRHLLEGRDFSVHTDHKPLTYALKAKPDRYSPREVRHLDYILQFTADIRYVLGSDNSIQFNYFMKDPSGSHQSK
nr:unnamed protein product [Spirometra erinaceieuropaei]